MPFTALLASALMAAAAAEEAPITVRGYPWAPFISPMGEPFRSRNAGESPISRWFGQADRNRDGMLTADEMQADADRFFARLDGNGDGQINPDEIKAYEWEIAPDVQVNSSWKRPRGQTSVRMAAKPEPDIHDDWLGRKGDPHDGYRINGLQGAARYGLLNIPQPVAGADADFNRLVTLAEFRQAAAYRFTLLDKLGLGRVSLAELEARLPSRPEGRAKQRKEKTDPRIGLPLPEGD
ncbi:MAG TPA: EF-hand domain-containing protein [Sphingomicrobium sp.]|nr:EF-hand domain-containing protein [Sphingomicrobium sp.]